jgi:hypothetical protein
MKTTPLIVALALITATATSVLGSEKNSPKKANTKKAKAVKVTAPAQQKVMLTGSYIKRDVHQNGLITDGPNPVYVLDRRSLDISGAATLSEVLIRTGFRR